MPTPAELSLTAQLDAMKAENAALKAKAASQSVIRFKVSEKGAFSIYGMGRFPFTFYISQWDAFVAKIDDAKAFVEANRAKFVTVKPVKTA